MLSDDVVWLDVAACGTLANTQHRVLSGTKHPVGLVPPDRVEMSVDGMNRLRHETANLHLSLLTINTHPH